jgi:ATP-binding cassette subfamily B protein
MGSQEEQLAPGLRHELGLIRKRGHQVWRLVPRHHRWALGAAGLVMVVTSCCNTAIPLFLGKLVDSVKRSTEAGIHGDPLFWSAILYLGLIAGAYLLRELLNIVRRYLVENTCTRVEKAMTVKLVAHLMKVELASLTHEKIGAIQGRIQRSVLGFVRFLRLMFLDLVPVVLTGMFAIMAALAKQPWLGLVMMGVIPMSLFLTVRQLISQKGVRLTLIRSREDMEGTIVELLSGIDYVRAADTQRREVERVARAAERRRVKEFRHHFQMSLFGCAKALNEGLFHILVLGGSIYLASAGMINYGDILTFSMLFLNVMAPLSEVHRVIDEGHEASLQVGDLLDLLAEPVDPSFLAAAAPSVGKQRSQPLLEIRDLDVDYVSASGTQCRALDRVSLTIYEGEKIGVAGRSGSGKSTWLRVLLRLTHPRSGAVRLAGVPLENVSRQAIGRLIGYVGQSPFVFAATIAENIAYGNYGISLSDIERAARMACLHDEIMAMPFGYQTLVAERGQNLSGGQRQRLALARVFLKDPPFLVLDEATSALDTISERHVQLALDQAQRDRTIIQVAHRLSTLVGMDRILVFDAGHIVETGTFGELVLRGGVFTELEQCASDNHRGNGHH